MRRGGRHGSIAATRRPPERVVRQSFSVAASTDRMTRQRQRWIADLMREALADLPA